MKDSEVACTPPLRGPPCRRSCSRAPPPGCCGSRWRLIHATQSRADGVYVNGVRGGGVSRRLKGGQPMASNSRNTVSRL